MNQYFIDVFFIDVELPCMNGFQLAQKIRQNCNYTLTNIVFVTGKQVDQLAIHKRYPFYRDRESRHKAGNKDRLLP